MKKIVVGLGLVILAASSSLAQEINKVTFNRGIFPFSSRVFDPSKVTYVANGKYTGIYIIEVEGQKYIVNAAGGIVKHEPNIQKGN